MRQGIGNREQETGNREQGTGNREQGTDVYKRQITASVKVNKLLESNAALRQRSDDLDNQHFSLDRRAKAIDTSFPEIAAIVHASGLGTREWLLINMAYVSDMMYVGMKKMGQVKDYPPNTITPENAAFVDAHFDQLSQLGQGLSPGR